MPLPVKSWNDFLELTDRAEITVYWIDEIDKENTRLTVATTKFFCKVIVDNETLHEYLKTLTERNAKETGPDVPLQQKFSKE